MPADSCRVVDELESVTVDCGLPSLQLDWRPLGAADQLGVDAHLQLIGGSNPLSRNAASPEIEELNVARLDGRGFVLRQHRAICRQQ